MGLYIIDEKYKCFTTFFWSFFLAWILAMITTNPLWILFLGLAVVFFRDALPHYDFGAANVFGRFVGGMFNKCENGADIQEFLFTILMQTAGALCGAIVYNLIFFEEDNAVPAVPVADTINYDDGKIFVLFAFANFFQAYAVNRLSNADTGLPNSMRLATAYTLSWLLCNVSFAGSIGGFTIDFGRLLAGEITNSDQVIFDKWWLLILATVAGWAICFLWQWAEAVLDNGSEAEPAKEAAAYGAPRADDNNAEEQA